MGVILSFINTLWNDFRQLRETSFQGKIFTYQNNNWILMAVYYAAEK